MLQKKVDEMTKERNHYKESSISLESRWKIAEHEKSSLLSRVAQTVKASVEEFVQKIQVKFSDAIGTSVEV